MDSFEFNKIAGAVLGSALFALGLGLLSESIFHMEEPEKPGFIVAVADTKAEVKGTESAAVEAAPIAARLKTADVARGQKTFAKCASCHTGEKGGPAKVGPNLWNVVGGPKAHMPGFKYSAAVADLGKAGSKWEFDDLDKFLTNPKGYIAGTAMGFAGLKSPDDRADVIAYLRSLSESPVALP